MGLFHIYPTQPTFIPDVDHSILTYVEVPTLDTTSTSEHESDCHSAPSHPTSEAGLPTDITPENIFLAFSSLTAALLMCWQYSGSNLKSAAELNCLWTNVIQDPKFDPKTTSIFNHDWERKFIEKYIHNESNPFKADHGWRCSSVPVHLPHERTCWKLGEQDPAIPVLEVNGVYHHNLTNVITSVLEDNVAMPFNMTPFEQYWKSLDTEELIRVYGEAYSSPAYLDAYYEINSLPCMAGVTEFVPLHDIPYIFLSSDRAPYLSIDEFLASLDRYQDLSTFVPDSSLF